MHQQCHILRRSRQYKKSIAVAFLTSILKLAVATRLWSLSNRWFKTVVPHGRSVCNQSNHRVYLCSHFDIGRRTESQEDATEKHQLTAGVTTTIGPESFCCYWSTHTLGWSYKRCCTHGLPMLLQGTWRNSHSPPNLKLLLLSWGVCVEGTLLVSIRARV